MGLARAQKDDCVSIAPPETIVSAQAIRIAADAIAHAVANAFGLRDVIERILQMPRSDLGRPRFQQAAILQPGSKRRHGGERRFQNRKPCQGADLATATRSAPRPSAASSVYIQSGTT